MSPRMKVIRKNKGVNGYDDTKPSSQISLETQDASSADIETPNEEPASVLLDGVAYISRAPGYTLDRLENSLIFHAGSGRTHVEVRDIHTPTIDKHEVSNVVLIRSKLSEEPIEPRGLVIMNTMASLGALVYEGDSERVSIVSRLSMFRGDDGALRLYVPLVACSTVFHATGLLNAIASTVGTQMPRLHISDDQDGPSCWSRPDFEFAKEGLKQSFGLFCNAGDDGLTAEIPWEPGGISTMTGDMTSLLIFNSSTVHPTMGSGLFCKLELPLHFEEDELVFFANKLNQVEYDSVDAPPFFGAWCSHLKSGRLCHITFWPNTLYHPGTVLNLGAWMFFRNRQAVAFISNNRK